MPRPRSVRSRAGAAAIAVCLVGSAPVAVSAALGSTAFAATGSSTLPFSVGTPQLAQISSPSGTLNNYGGSAQAPWNEYQGDSEAPPYTSVGTGSLYPTYTPGGAQTTTTETATPTSGSPFSITSTEPNISVYPGADSSSDNNAIPYAAGVVGTPGTLDDYCGSGDSTAETSPGATVSRQPAGTTLPLAPAYFPHVVRNADGSLTGYFDYRPKDADEAIVAGTSTDNGRTWTYGGEALDQNPAYCPTADTTDDGEGHPNVITVNGNTFLYTLPRAAGDNNGVGMIVHEFSPSESEPLGTPGQLPATEPVGIDPDAFVPTGTASFQVTSSTAVTIPLTTLGTANSPESLIAGSFIDLTATQAAGGAPVVITCTGLGTSSLTGCTTPSISGSPDTGASVMVRAGDLIEQVIGFTTKSSDELTIPSGPNTSTGSGGTASLTVDPVQQTVATTTPGDPAATTTATFVSGATTITVANPSGIAFDENVDGTGITSTGSGTVVTAVSGDTVTISQPTTKAETNETVTFGGYSTNQFANPTTGSLYGSDVPIRLYIDGTAVYCTNSNNNPTYHIEDCTTGTGGAPLAISESWEPITADPIVPATAYAAGAGDAMTSGLAAPDGIVGTLPSYPGTACSPVVTTNCVPSGATYVMYTTKELDYFVAAETTGSGTFSSSTAGSIVATPGPYISQDLPASGRYNLQMGATAPNSTTAIIPVTCTGLVFTTAAANPGATFSGCTVASQYNGYTWASNSYIAAPGATTVSPSVLAETGEGKSTDVSKLYKNNEDLEVLQVAWTQNGSTFSTSGLANGGLISGENNCQSGTPDPVCSSSANAGVAQPYDDISNTTSTADPPNGLNEYADNDAANETGPSTGGTDAGGVADATEMRWVGSAGSVIDDNGTEELFLSGAWPGDGDSDAFNQIFYATSTNGEYWTVPTPVLSTDYSFAASVAQDSSLANGEDDPLGISAYYSGRAYAPSVVQNPDGTLTMVFGADRVPKSITTAGTAIGVNPYPGTSSSSSGAYQPSTNPYYGGNSAGTSSDPALDRNILVVTLDPVSDGSIPTTTSLTSTLTPSTTVGASVSYTATVASSSDGGPPTGTLAFSTGSGTIPGCGAVALPQRDLDTATCTTMYSGVVDNTVQASYSGDSLFSPSANATFPTTVTLSSSDGGSAVTGETVTYTAVVADPGGPTPTGTLSFSDTAGLISGCGAVALSSSGSPASAQCSVTYPATLPIPDQVSAVYSGDASTYTSSSTPLSESLGMASTTTVLSVSDSSGAAPVVGEPVTYEAAIGVVAPGSGSPTGTVDFSDSTGALSSCSSVTLSSGTASCTVIYTAALASPDAVSATYSGDDNFTGSSSTTVDEAVNPSPTSVTLTESTSSIDVGQSVTFTAAVSPAPPGAGSPTGTVDFSDSAGQVTTCGFQAVSKVDGAQEAQCTVEFSAADGGGDTISASYSGDGNFLGQVAVPTSLTIDPASTTVSVTSSDNGSAVNGETVIYTAAVAVASPGAATPTGTVEFSDTAGVVVGCGAQALTVNSQSQYVATCPVSYPDALGAENPDVLTATYSGDANTVTSTGTSDETVLPASTSVVLGATWSGAGSSPVVGQPVTYTATVEVVAPGAGTPSGTVEFSDTATALSGCGSVVLTSAQAQCTVTYTSALSTPDSVTAAYSGDANFDGSSSHVLQPVGQASSSVALTEVPGSIVTGQSVTFTATVTASAPGAGTPTGYVDFSDAAGEVIGCGTQQLARVSGTMQATCTATFVSALTTPDSVTATYSGDGNFTGTTSSPANLIVDQASTSTTVSSQDEDRAVVGEPVTYQATVGVDAPGSGTPTGTVTFADSAGKISGCDAMPVAPVVTCTVTYSAPLASADDVTASYSGDANFVGSSGSLDESVAKDLTTTTLTASPDPAVTGTPTVLSATVLVDAPGASTPSGNVAFLQGSSVLCSGVAVTERASGATADCSVTYSRLPSGSRSITARYSGDANETGSTSAPLVLTVTEATHLSLSAAPSPTHYGETVTLHAGGLPNAATGSVSFSLGGTELCDVAVVHGGAICVAPSSLTPGTYSAAAAYSGDATFAPSGAATSFTVVKAPTSITLKESPDEAPFGTAVVLVAGRIPEAATGTVTFTVDGTTQVLPVSSPTTDIAVPAGLAPGSYAVSVAYSGDGNFTGSDASSTLVIRKAYAPFSASASPSSAAASRDITLEATGFPAAATGTVAFTSGPVALCTATLTSGALGAVADCAVVSGLAAKTYHVSARYSGSTDFDASSARTIFTVT